MAKTIEFIPATGEKKILSSLTFSEASDLVGGYVEVLNCLGVKGLLLVDEEGRLKGKPINKEASSLYGGIIVGDAIFTDRIPK